MNGKREHQILAIARFFTILALTCILSVSAAADEHGAEKKAEHFSAKAVKNISPERAINFLANANLATATRMPDTNTILMTGSSSDLSKATKLLELVDSKDKWVVATVIPNEVPNAKFLQTQLSGEMKDISIQSFKDSAPAVGKTAALVDIHNKTIVVAAPMDQFNRIVIKVEKLAKTMPDQSQPADETSETVAEIESVTESPKDKLQDEEFFNELMQSLAEAEKIESQMQAEKLQKDEVEKTPEPGVTETKVSQKIHETEKSSKAEKSTIVDLDQKQAQPSFKPGDYDVELGDLGNAELELNLPELLNIVELIDLVGKYLNLDLLYDKNEIKGQVTLRVQDKIKVKELYPLLESVLKFRGFVMSRSDNLVVILPLAKVDPGATQIVDGQKMAQPGDIIISRVFNLQHITPATAKSLLTKMKLGIKMEEAANRLFITAYTHRMPKIEELLQMVDKPGKLKQFRYRQLRYTMAKALATQVEKLTEQLGTASVTISAPTVRKDSRGRPISTPAPTPKKGDSVFLDVDERTNRILMIGTPDQLNVVDTLIDSLDVARQDLRTLKVYEIQYVGAEEIIDKLNQLGIISGGRTTSRSSSGRITPPSSKSSRSGTSKAPTPAAPAGTVLTEEGLVDEPQVVTIEATNSLMVNATAEQHAQIVTIIGYVDAEPEQTAINYVVYPLENQDPAELAGVLQQLVQETIQETQDKGSNVVRTTTKARFEEDVTIIAEPKTYSLIVYASKKNQQWIKSLIEQLDEYRPQVLLDVTLVQITKDDAFHFDLKLLGSYPDFEYGSSEIPDFDEEGFWSNLLNSTDRDSFLEGKSFLGDFTGFYGTEQISALLSAVETKKYGRVMARPKLLVNDNETGSIQTTQTTYVARTETQVIGTETPKETESVVFEDYSAGITLNITPHISTGDMLRLQITLNRSGFTGNLTEDLVKPPNKQDSDVDTVVTVPNNSTIILGGVERISDSKGGKKVPLLGDLPIIGGLFRDVSRSGGHDKLYIFVKAHILRPGNDLGLEDLKRVSRKNREAFEKLEAEMQEYSDWPGLEPKPLDPVKILEDD